MGKNVSFNPDLIAMICAWLDMWGLLETIKEDLEKLITWPEVEA